MPNRVPRNFQGPGSWPPKGGACPAVTYLPTTSRAGSRRLGRRQGSPRVPRAAGHAPWSPGLRTEACSSPESPVTVALAPARETREASTGRLLPRASMTIGLS